MIVRTPPNTLAMLLAMRGSVMSQIWLRIVIVGVMATAVVTAPQVWYLPLVSFSLAPLSLLGLVLSIFLGFRNNACYDRWWEARKQWGHLIAQQRALARDVAVLLPDDEARRRRMLKRSIAFAGCLAARLRGLDEVAAVSKWLSAEDAEKLAKAGNRPSAILRWLSEETIQAMRAGEIDEILFRVIEDRIEEMNGVQAACERIRSTPTPFAYSLLLHRTSWIFCLLAPFGLIGSCGLVTPLISVVLAYAFFGLDALGDELEEPFGLLPNDLPLDAMVRVIEIDLLEVAGERDLPPPLAPIRYQLT